MDSSHSSPPSVEAMIDAVTSTFVAARRGDTDAQLAQALVFNAGRLAWRMRSAGVDTDYKTSVSDVVTDADRAAERFVAGALAALRPDDGIVGEEGAAAASTSGRTWVIDPVDGTYNFTRGSDYWCSAVALVRGDAADPDEVIVGAVHRPDMGYTWCGGPEHPTTCDGTPVAGPSAEPLERSAVATYLHPTKLAEAPTRDAWLAVVTQAATLRMLGAASVDLAGIAAGTHGAWFQHSVAPWDWLPGRALVEAAGGTTATVEAGGVTWRIAGGHACVTRIAQLLKEAQ